jgi:hypothetical protein
MGIFSRFALTRTLSQLTNDCETVLEVQQVLVSAGKVRPDSTAYLHSLDSRIAPKMDRLCKHDKYRITESLLSNIRVATALGRHDRVYAQKFLFGFLVQYGVAATLEEWSEHAASFRPTGHRP